MCQNGLGIFVREPAQCDPQGIDIASMTIQEHHSTRAIGQGCVDVAHAVSAAAANSAARLSLFMELSFDFLEKL